MRLNRRRTRYSSVRPVQTQFHLACFESCCDAGRGLVEDGIGELYRGRAVVAGAVVAGFLDAVGVVPGALDDAGVGAVAAGVEVVLAGDAGYQPGEDALAVWSGGKAGSATRRRMVRTVRLNLTRSGSMPAAVAALQIRALTAWWVSR
jgi:hypothetical protein